LINADLDPDFEEEVIYRDLYGGRVVDVEQRVCGPVCVALVDDAGREILLPRCVISRENSVEVLSHSHQVRVVAQVWIKLELRGIGRRSGQR